MPITVTWYGHACIGLEVGEHRLLVDPFLTGNPLAAAAPDQLDPTVVLVSHGHGDHVGDALDIARRTGALVISNFEITNWFQAQGHANVHPQHIGDRGQYVERLRVPVIDDRSVLSRKLDEERDEQ
ncbi:MAG TPA: MBL fold metallo-hydrolase, partial [Anaerolineae bacterium]|nr:MBL fold metallo-hydrolase [Anaerolineae bacterium]